MKETEIDTVPFILEGDKTVKIPMDDVRQIHQGIRPIGMDFEEFKEIRSQIKKSVKKQLEGEYTHVSKLGDTAWLNFLAQNGVRGYRPQKGITYYKKEE